MQATALILVALLLAASPATASPLGFDTPGEFHAEWVGAHEASWALLVFRNDTAATFDASSVQDVSWTNESYTTPIRVQYDGNEFNPKTTHENSTDTLAGPMQVQGTFRPQHAGSLFIQAERLTLNLHDSRGILSSKDAAHDLRGFARWDDVKESLYRIPGDDFGASVVILATPQPSARGAFNFDARGASHLEWYNAQTTCAGSSECPTSGGSAVTSLPPVRGYTITSERHDYEVLQGQSMEIHGRGTLDYVLFGSAQMNLGVAGSVRLPLANAQKPCPTCAAPDDQTFSATGNMTLQNLQLAPGGLQADLGGDIETARFDETPVAPASLFAVRGAAAGAAVLGFGWLLLKLLKMLWPALFTRHKEEGPLTNERRRMLYECIVKKPGVHIREALREAGVPSGSGRYHVTQLVRAGLVVERRHRHSVCLFPNDTRLADSWQQLAALRDPDYRLLYDWIAGHPESAQREIVAAFADLHGWKRGVTRKRVERLASDGILRSRDQGRYKFYSTAKPAIVTMAPQLVGFTTA